MKRLPIGIILVATLVAFNSFQTDLPKSAWKKIEKEWSKLWPDQAIEKSPVVIDMSVHEALQIKELTYAVHKLSAADTLVGYMMISKALGRYDYFDYMVIYNPDLTIKLAKVLIYREDWGGEIASTRWLRQFIGLSASDQIKLDHDIQGISGATISSRSATIGVKQLTDVIGHLKDSGLLD
jgi:hypothetical protein